MDPIENNASINSSSRKIGGYTDPQTLMLLVFVATGTCYIHFTDALPSKDKRDT